MTNREAHEEAAGMGLEDMFFRFNKIDPDAEARVFPPEPLDDELLAAARAFTVPGWTLENHDSVWTMPELMARFAEQYAAKLLAERDEADKERDKVAREEGIRFACAVVDEMYGGCNTHQFMQGDCVLAKLNMLDKSKLRPNPVDHEAAIIERYKIALADAIRRPMGVVPDSARGLVSQEEVDAAELRRIEGGGE